MLQESLIANSLANSSPSLTPQQRQRALAIAAELRRRGLAPTAAQPEFRGAALALQSFRGRECIISGPSETGKTWAALYLLDALARAHPKMQGAILRKV